MRQYIAILPVVFTPFRPPWKRPAADYRRPTRAAQHREELIDQLVKPIRADVFKMLIDKQPERKKNDSNDDPTTAIFSISSVAEAAVEQLAGSIKRLELTS